MLKSTKGSNYFTLAFQLYGPFAPKAIPFRIITLRTKNRVETTMILVNMFANV